MEVVAAMVVDWMTIGMDVLQIMKVIEEQPGVIITITIAIDKEMAMGLAIETIKRQHLYIFV